MIYALGICYNGTGRNFYVDWDGATDLNWDWDWNGAVE